MSVLTLRPESDSSVTQARSTGSYNYALIDETTLDEADCCVVGSSSTQTLTDIYGFPNHTSESGTINSVTLKCYCKYTLFGTDATDTYVNPAVKIGGTVYNGGNQTLTASTALYSKQWTTNPATSAAWSWTEIDDLLAGDTMTSHNISKTNGKSANCYQLWVEVYYTAGGGSPVWLPFMKHNFIPPLIGGY